MISAPPDVAPEAPAAGASPTLTGAVTVPAPTSLTAASRSPWHPEAPGEVSAHSGKAHSASRDAQSPPRAQRNAP